MGRQKRDLSNTWEKLKGNDGVEASESEVSRSEGDKSSGESNAVTAQSEASELRPESMTDLFAIMEAQKARKTFEERHTRTSFFVENDLRKELDKVARKEPHGFKTRFINFAIRKALIEYEEARGK